MGKAALIDLAIAAAVALILLARGSLTPEMYGEWLVWSGLAGAAVGAILVHGAFEGRASTMSYAATAGDPSQEQRVRQSAADLSSVWRRVAFMVLVGAPLVAAGILIDPRFP